MPAFPIRKSLEDTVEEALKSGFTHPGMIAGKITQYSTDSPSPAEVNECIQRIQGPTENTQSSSAGDSGNTASTEISDQELRAALDAAGVSGESAGELPG
jgi:hypothetical protein